MSNRRRWKWMPMWKKYDLSSWHRGWRKRQRETAQQPAQSCHKQDDGVEHNVAWSAAQNGHESSIRTITNAVQYIGRRRSSPMRQATALIAVTLHPQPRISDIICNTLSERTQTLLLAPELVDHRCTLILSDAAHWFTLVLHAQNPALRGVKRPWTRSTEPNMLRPPVFSLLDGGPRSNPATLIAVRRTRVDFLGSCWRG